MKTTETPEGAVAGAGSAQTAIDEKLARLEQCRTAIDEKLARLEQCRTALDASERALLFELYPTIMNGHCDRVLRCIRAWGVSRDDEEDVLQDIFILLFTRVTDHGIRETLRATLGAVTKGRLLHYLRAKRKTPEMLSPPSSGSWLPESMADLERAVDLRTLAERFKSELSDPHKDVIQKVVLDGLTIAEAAVALGIPEGTVKSRLRVATEILYMLVAPWLPESEREAP